MKSRINEAKWFPTQKRWQINVQRDGKRRTFCSTKPGREGKAEAHAKAEAWLKNNTTDESTSVEVWYTRWLASLISENSIDKSQQLWKNWIGPRIGKKKLSALNETHLQGIVNDMAKKGLADKTMRHMVFTLKAFIKFCRVSKATTLFPEALHVPKNAPKGEKAILTPYDLKLLFDEKNDKHWYINMFRMGVVTGMRPGELLGLQWGDIKANKISIQRAVNYKNQITTGKNDNARRSIMLSKKAQNILAAQREKLKATCMVTMWVFPNKQGNHAVLHTIENSWAKFSAGMTKTSPYCWRHTFVSVTSDMPDGLKKRVVGHSRNMDAEGVYGHEVQGDMERAAEIIEQSFSEILD